MNAHLLSHYGFRNPFAEEHGKEADNKVSQESFFHKVWVTVLLIIGFVLLFIFL